MQVPSLEVCLLQTSIKVFSGQNVLLCRKNLSIYQHGNIKIQQLNLTFINKPADLAFKITWMPNGYYLLVLTFICVLSPCVILFPLKQAVWGFRAYFFIIPYWAFMSHVSAQTEVNA